MGIDRRGFMGAVAGGGLTGFSIPFVYERLTGDDSLKLQADVYRALGGEEIPAHPYLRDIVKAPPDYQDFIAPEDPVVEEVAEGIDLELREDEVALDIPGPDFSYVGEELPDYHPDDWIHPSEYLETREGDCEDHALALASLLEAKGYDSRLVIGLVRFPLMDEQGLHAVSETEIAGEHYIGDVSWPEKLFTRENYRKNRTLEWEPLSMFGKDEDYRLYSPDW